MDNNEGSISPKINELDVTPSDFSQAILRFVIVSCLLIWSYFNATDRSIGALLAEGFVILTLSYWFFSIAFLAWTKFLNTKSNDTSSTAYRLTRIGAVFADIFAISAYTALAGSHGLILYPIYLQTIIGHGYRFGLPYLYLSNTLGLVGFTGAIFFNRAFADTSLVVAYYLGLLLVPLYSLLLLRRHAKVQAKLKFVNESRSRFIANMSHELRTPLHAILSLNEVLREELVDDGKTENGASEKLRMVNVSAQHLLSLVNRILDIASADQAQSKTVRLQPVNLREIINRAINISAGAGYTKGIEVRSYVSPTVPVSVISSSEYLEEILVNILGNGVKYTEQGYVHLHVSTDETNNVLKLRVSDTGIGIKEELLPTIFEPFTMGDNEAARQHYGTGLGLTITKQYIEGLEGRVGITSKVGVGTSIDIELPLTLAEPPVPKDDKKVSALIISSNGISASERLLFEHFDFDVVTMPLHQAINSNLDNEKLDIALVSSEYNKNSDEIRELSRSLPIPFANYSESILTAPNLDEKFQSFSFSTTIRPGFKDDIDVARYLIIQDDREDSTEIQTQETFQILVADDNEINLTTARLALESVGHRVDLVNNGESALDSLARKDYDLVLMDMHMPGMNGIEALKLYSYETENPVPVILLTADVTEEARLAAEEVNVTALLNKPIMPHQLRLAVQRFAQRQSTHEYSSNDEVDSQDYIMTNRNSNGAIFDPREIRELSECGASPAELEEMIQMFETDATVSVKLAMDAASNDRFSIVRSEMHSLRGAAGALGATALHDKAHEIEVYPLATAGIDDSEFEQLLPLISETTKLLLAEISAQPSELHN